MSLAMDTLIETARKQGKIITSMPIYRPEYEAVGIDDKTVVIYWHESAGMSSKDKLAELVESKL